MKPQRIITSLFTIALMAIGVSLTIVPSAQADETITFDPRKEVAKTERQIEFEKVNDAIQMGAAWGDRVVGPHGTFGKFIPNFITPVHTHTFAYHGVVLEGVMTNPFGEDDDDAEDAPRLGPGSYWYVPAGAPHATACVSNTPCKFYFHSDGAFNFLTHDDD